MYRVTVPRGKGVKLSILEEKGRKLKMKKARDQDKNKFITNLFT